MTAGGQQGAAAGPQGTRGRGRPIAADAALLAGGAALTMLIAVAATRSAAAAAVLLLWWRSRRCLLGRKRVLRARIGTVLTVLLVSLPLLAILGPSFALPAAPQAFLYRIVLALVLYVGACYLLVRRDPMPFAAKDLALPAALWFAWLLLGLVWAPDKLAAIDYVAIVITMAAVFLATAATGGKRRRLVWFGYSCSSATPSSSASPSWRPDSGSACRPPVCSPRRRRRRMRSPASSTTRTTLPRTSPSAGRSCSAPSSSRGVCAGCCYTGVHRHGRRRLRADRSRSPRRRRDLVARRGRAVLAPGPKSSSRAGKAVMGLVIVGLCVAAGWLLFNDSSSGMLRQFRLEALLNQAEANRGSGAIRSNLTERGLQIAG